MHQRVWQANSWNAPPRLRSGSQRHPEKSVGLRQTGAPTAGASHPRLQQFANNAV